VALGESRCLEEIIGRACDGVLGVYHWRGLFGGGGWGVGRVGLFISVEDGAVDGVVGRLGAGRSYTCIGLGSRSDEVTSQDVVYC
jgi:hypothetical protein